MKVEESIELINNELRRTSSTKFTGTLALTINMNEGGIAQISVNLSRNLIKQAKGKN